MSRTPIQNNLTDFLELFEFLQFTPYDDPRIFNADVANLWRNKSVDEATEIFETLLSCFMIRRIKAILNLHSREDKIIGPSFDEEEDEHYRRIEEPVFDMIDLTTGERNKADVSWMSAIRQIN
jgi:SNF2 family DNA or RNA helicase